MEASAAPPMWVLPSNASDGDLQLPRDMTFNSGHVVSIACYSALMVASAAGNLTVLTIILRQRGRARSRVNHMLMHLAIADLLVTFLMMPLEIAWAATVSWRAGDLLCRVMAVCRVFGLFLSSFVLVCISMDRYFAILRPMSLSQVDRRGRIMLTAAWVMSFLCSMPQAMVFSVQSHPTVTWYEQCITWGVLKSHRAEVLYAIFSSSFMYGIPLLIIIFAYGSIVAEIFRRSRRTGDEYLLKALVPCLRRRVPALQPGLPRAGQDALAQDDAGHRAGLLHVLDALQHHVGLVRNQAAKPFAHNIPHQTRSCNRGADSHISVTPREYPESSRCNSQPFSARPRSSAPEQLQQVAKWRNEKNTQLFQLATNGWDRNGKSSFENIELT
ncbi:Cardioacceleratory peptide receptor [Gryllus bimaculatus]|nr:Cardioacceleratory peptide receptor [Gryllus bimaculatus]